MSIDHHVVGSCPDGETCRPWVWRLVMSRSWPRMLVPSMEREFVRLYLEAGPRV